MTLTRVKKVEKVLICLNPALLKAVDRRAAEQSESRSFIIRQALHEYLATPVRQVLEG